MAGLSHTMDSSDVTLAQHDTQELQKKIIIKEITLSNHIITKHENRRGMRLKMNLIMRKYNHFFQIIFLWLNYLFICDEEFDEIKKNI